MDNSTLRIQYNGSIRNLTDATNIYITKDYGEGYPPTISYNLDGDKIILYKNKDIERVEVVFNYIVNKLSKGETFINLELT